MSEAGGPASRRARQAPISKKTRETDRPLLVLPVSEAGVS